MEAPGGVDEHELGAAPLGLLDHLVAHARGVGAALARHHVDARALAPDLELLDGGRAEGVGAADEAARAGLTGAPGELAHRGRLAGPVDADEQDAARKVGEGVALGGGELRGETAGQRVAKLVGTGEVLARRLLAQVVGHAHGDLGAHVTHDERVLEVLPEVLVDLAAHVEDLVDRLARALEAGPQAVEKAHYASTTFPVSRSRRWDTTRLTPSACMETP